MRTAFLLLAFKSLTLLAFPASPFTLFSSHTPEFSFGTETISSSYDGVENAPSNSVTRWNLGFTYPFSLRKIVDTNARLGIFLSGPFGGLRSLKAYQASDLYALRYGHLENQFQAKAGLDVQLLANQLWIGTGLRFSLSGAGNAEATLSTVNPTGRLALDVGLNTVFYSGLFARNERLSASLTYQQEASPEFIQKFDAKAPIGGENTFHQPLTARSTLYFEPHVFDLETQYDSGPVLFGVGLQYQLWNRYQHPVLLAETEDSRGNIAHTVVPDSTLRNTWNPRATLGIPFSDVLVSSLGYTYQPSAIVDLSGVGNPLDSNTHIVALGFNYRAVDLALSLVFQRHFFESRTVTKLADSTSYTFSGGAYTVGAQLGLPL